MSDNPKLFEQHHNDMIETGRFFVSTEITLHDLFLIFAPPAPAGWVVRHSDALDREKKWRVAYADTMLAERSKK